MWIQSQKDHEFPDGTGRGRSEEPPCQVAAGGPDGLHREIPRRSDIDRSGESRQAAFDDAGSGASSGGGLFMG